MSILDAIGYLIQKLPIQGRIERIRNQIDQLEKEQKKLVSEGVKGEWDVKKSKKYTDNDARIKQLYSLLKNREGN